VAPPPPATPPQPAHDLAPVQLPTPVSLPPASRPSRLAPSTASQSSWQLSARVLDFNPGTLQFSPLRSSAPVEESVAGLFVDFAPSSSPLARNLSGDNLVVSVSAPDSEEGETVSTLDFVWESERGNYDSWVSYDLPAVFPSRTVVLGPGASCEVPGPESYQLLATRFRWAGDE
jgi:hypothetical protein